ncbi:MAG: VanZ like family [Pseudomonadota bacterium]|jgi:hypothetical protein
MIHVRNVLHSLRICVAFLFWPALGLVIWGSLAAISDPILGLGMSFEDLIVHFTAYGGLAGMAAIALKDRRRLVPPLLGLVVLGGVVEIAQFYAGRDMSWADALANACGVASGGTLARAIVERLRRRYDSLSQIEGQGP